MASSFLPSATWANASVWKVTTFSSRVSVSLQRLVQEVDGARILEVVVGRDALLDEVTLDGRLRRAGAP